MTKTTGETKGKTDIFENIYALSKRRGFIYPGSEIYGGLAGTWDYGPLGAELKRNLKNEFWKFAVWERDDVVGLDASIIMNPKVWEASGHLESFSDPLAECKKCHHRFRADKIKENKCPDCGGELTKAKKFNLMVETYLGVIEDEKQKTYLRGEITQGVHVNFKNIVSSTRVKLPFGKSERPSETKLLPGSSRSGRASSSRWKFNFIRSRMRIFRWSGLSIGKRKE